MLALELCDAIWSLGVLQSVVVVHLMTILIATLAARVASDVMRRHRDSLASGTHDFLSVVAAMAPHALAEGVPWQILFAPNAVLRVLCAGCA